MSDKLDLMSYAIVGSGNIGSAIAGHFGRQEIDVLIANEHGPESLAELTAKLGPSVKPVWLADALRADVVIFAIPFGAIAQAAASAPAWAGRIVVDASNAIDFPAFTPTDLGGRPSSEVVASWVPDARVVKAFNTLAAPVLASAPDRSGGKRVLFLSGNDAAAKAEIASLMVQLGFAPLDLGRLNQGGLLQQFAGSLTNQNLFAFD